jgi:hypothetical protein
MPRPQMPQISGSDTGELVVGGRGPSFEHAQHAPPPSVEREARGGSVRAVLFIALLLALCGGGYFGYLEFFAEDGGEERASATTATGTPAAAAARKPPPATAQATRSSTPSRPATSGAPPAGRTDPQATELVIASEPARARIYLDGALVGKTPLTLEPTADRHKLAIIQPGYKPHIAEIDGRGKVQVALEEVTPSNGPAGIKIRCRQKNRYYVTIDGAPTGQLCPTERLGVELGEHTAEIYDPVTDTRRVYKVKVEDTRLSVRVRVD